MEDNLLRQDPDVTDVDEDEEGAMEVASVDDHGIEIDYSSLIEKLKEVCSDHRFSPTNPGLSVNSHRAQMSRRGSQRRFWHSLPSATGLRPDRAHCHHEELKDVDARHGLWFMYSAE